MIISLLFALPLLFGCEESESRLFCDVFVNNRGTVRVQKGVYLISFDAVATFSDGSVARVRSSEHANAERAVNLLGDVEAVVLNLTVIN